MNLSPPPGPVVVLLDVSGSMAEQEKFGLAMYLCGAVASCLQIKSSDGLTYRLRIFAASGEDFAEIDLNDDRLRRLQPSGRFNVRFACEKLSDALAGHQANVLLLTDKRVSNFLFEHELASCVGALHLVLLGLEHGELEPDLRDGVSHYSADDALFALERLLSSNAATQRRLLKAVS